MASINSKVTPISVGNTGAEKGVRILNFEIKAANGKYYQIGFSSLMASNKVHAGLMAKQDSFKSEEEAAKWLHENLRIRSNDVNTADIEF